MVRKRREGGFSLIELLIVVTIIAILAAVAYPSYELSIRKSRRNDAQAELMNMAQLQEAFYANNGTYTSDMKDFGYPNQKTNYSPEGRYRVSIIDPDASCPIARCYVYQAVPTPGTDQAKDQVQEYRLSSTGQKQRDEGGGLIDGWK